MILNIAKYEFKVRKFKLGFPSYFFFKNRDFSNYKIYARASRVPSFLVGTRFNVYTGRDFRNVLAKPHFPYYSLGSFVNTKLTGSSIHRRKKKK